MSHFKKAPLSSSQIVLIECPFCFTKINTEVNIYIQLLLLFKIFILKFPKISTLRKILLVI